MHLPARRVQSADTMGTVTDRTPAEEVARALARFAPRLARNIVVALDEEPSLQISLRQLRILERLAERPHRTTELASLSMVRQPTATAAIAPLEARGLVRRQRDPRDGRASLIELTAEGRAVWDECNNRIHRRLRSIIGDVTDADLRAVLRVERLLLSGMDRARSERALRHGGGSRPT